MQEIKSRLLELEDLISQAVKKVDLKQKKSELEKLENEMKAEGFWDDSDQAQLISQEASDLRKSIETWEETVEEIKSYQELSEEISPLKDPQTYREFEEMVENLENKWRKLEISTFLNGKYDKLNVILSIHTGTGGTDAADFAEMLLRMYLRYAEKMDWTTQILDKSLADEAGIKSATISIKGSFAYGYLKCERGVHRLVRLSPFNSKNTRETSFAMIEVLPEINKDHEVEIDPEDLRIDVYRASGKGGQSVNTTDSAVRITHEPTGIVAQCQNERSQLQNKQQAMQILQGKLIDLMEKEQAQELADLRGKQVEISWGNHIRSYVLHPYKMVKDHRTNYEENNPDRVLDGEIQGFIEAELKS